MRDDSFQVHWQADLITLWVFNVADGTLDKRTGYPLPPSRVDPEAQTRRYWCEEKPSYVLSDTHPYQNFLAFDTLGAALDEMQRWTERRAQQLRACYARLAVEAGRPGNADVVAVRS
jgi:hypothetical protein